MKLALRATVDLMAEAIETQESDDLRENERVTEQETKQEYYCSVL